MRANIVPTKFWTLNRLYHLCSFSFNHILYNGTLCQIDLWYIVCLVFPWWMVDLLEEKQQVYIYTKDQSDKLVIYPNSMVSLIIHQKTLYSSNSLISHSSNNYTAEEYHSHWTLFHLSIICQNQALSQISLDISRGASWRSSLLRLQSNQPRHWTFWLVRCLPFVI